MGYTSRPRLPGLVLHGIVLYGMVRHTIIFTLTHILLALPKCPGIPRPPEILLGLRPMVWYCLVCLVQDIIPS